MMDNNFAWKIHSKFVRFNGRSGSLKKCSIEKYIKSHWKQPAFFTLMCMRIGLKSQENNLIFLYMYETGRTLSFQFPNENPSTNIIAVFFQFLIFMQMKTECKMCALLWNKQICLLKYIAKYTNGNEATLALLFRRYGLWLQKKNRYLKKYFKTQVRG